MTDLGALGGHESEGESINSSGQIVGYAETDGFVNHAFLYSSGAMVDLGTLGGSYSNAYCISNDGQIVGISDTVPAEVPHAFLDANGSMVDLGTLGGSESQAYGITQHPHQSTGNTGEHSRARLWDACQTESDAVVLVGGIEVVDGIRGNHVG